MIAQPSRCYTEPYNQGHFENGVFVPDCKQCGKCCEGFWLNADRDEDDVKYTLMKAGTHREGNVIYVYAPCKMLKDKKCTIHEEERPDCCKRFGFGNYFHPPGCAFFGGDVDAELSPHIPQEQQ